MRGAIFIVAATLFFAFKADAQLTAPKADSGYFYSSEQVTSLANYILRLEYKVGQCDSVLPLYRLQVGLYQKVSAEKDTMLKISYRQIAELQKAIDLQEDMIDDWKKKAGRSWLESPFLWIAVGVGLGFLFKSK